MLMGKHVSLTGSEQRTGLDEDHARRPDRIIPSCGSPAPSKQGEGGEGGVLSAFFWLGMMWEACRIGV